MIKKLIEEYPNIILNYIYRILEKFRHLHHDFYKYPKRFNIYKMKPSQYYRGEMYVWQYSDHQVRVMMEEKCDFNDFQLIKN